MCGGVYMYAYVSMHVWGLIVCICACVYVSLSHSTALFLPALYSSCAPTKGALLYAACVRVRVYVCMCVSLCLGTFWALCICVYVY